MKLVIASNNGNKVREIKEILGGFFKEIYSLKELNVDIEVEETGKTFRENAYLKAKAVSDITKACVIADDSGLCVNALDGAPGLYSARYAGEEQNDAANKKLLLKNMADKTDRSAYFVTAIVLLYPDGKEIYAEGRTEGSILYAEEGTRGFGYDALFFSKDLQKSFGLATSEEKNAVSHRGRALRELERKLIATNYNRHS
ncbi:MAG: XTP/dITP diphosphatase [Clostridiales bacterium]|jgi:XTP/dITP diphosphohydrolase|nr:XTP/dITP diphosphatase [Clostridiales bacterium]MDY4655385.1 XTP/dITP diphosphatase [Eubacteriales bacterium]